MVEPSGRAKTGRPKKASYRENRTCQLNIRLSEDDMRHLSTLADFYGMTKTDYILMKIDEGLIEMKRIKRRTK